MYKLKVKQYGIWTDFIESSTNKTPVIFKTLDDAEDEKNKRVEMFGPIYKVVKAKQ